MKKIFMFTATTLGLFVIIITLFWILPIKNNTNTNLKEESTATDPQETSHVYAK